MALKYFRWLVEYYGLDILFSSSAANQANQTTPSSTATTSRLQQLEAIRNSYVYKNELSEAHLGVIKELEVEESNRLNTIESKLSQVITQSGLVFALTSFIAPVFGDNLNDLQLIYKIIIILIFFLSFISYLGAILIASNILDVYKFTYKRTLTASVIDQPDNKEDFIAKRIKDLIHQIHHNTEVNNRKGDLLILANRWFVTGFAFSGIISFCICFLLFFISNPDHKLEELSAHAQMIELENRISTNRLNIIENRIQQLKDSSEQAMLLENFDSLRIKIGTLDQKAKFLLKEIKSLK